MGSFLEFGSIPEGERKPPVVVDTDPRGKSTDGFLQILEDDRNFKEAEAARWEAIAEENDFGYTNYIGKSIVQESAAANLFGLAEDFVEDYDPEFDPAPFIEEDWPDWRKEAMMEAKNESHAQILLDRTEEQHAYNLEGQYYGGKAMALQMVAALASPETAMLGIGEVAVLTKLGLTGFGRVALGAATGSLTNAGQEMVVVANNKSRDKLGVAIAAGFGATFGGVTSMFNPKRLDEIRKLDDMIGKDISGGIKTDLDMATGDIRHATDPAEWASNRTWNRAEASGEAAKDVDGSYVAMVGGDARKFDTKDEAIAAIRLQKQGKEVTPENLEAQARADFDAEVARYDRLVPRRKGGKLSSIGLEGRSSANPVTRFLHYLLTEDASGTGGKNVAKHSGALRQDMHAHQMRSLWHTTRFQQAKIWAKETKNKSWKPWDTGAMDKFDDEVIKEVGYRRYPSTRPEGSYVPDSVKIAADAYSELQKMRFSKMKNAGVEGYDTIVPDALYIKHKWDGIAMSTLARKHDKAFVVNLLKQAILAGNEFKRAAKYGQLGDSLTDDFKEKTAAHMADAIFERFTTRPDTLNLARAGWLTKKETGELRRRAEQLIANPEDLKHLMSAAEGRDARLVNELLSQIEMDTNFTINGIAVRNLLDTNLGSSLDTEIRRSAGKTAMAEMGFESQDAFLDMTQKAGKYSRETLGLSEEELKRTNLHNQKLWNLVMGENLEADADSALAGFARAFRKQATLASLNQVGFAQAAETGRLVAAIGVRQFISQIPQYKRMIRNMKNGTFKDGMLNDIEAAFGIRLGDNELLNHPMLMTESGGFGITKADSTTFRAGIDAVMNKGLHVQGYLNGMNYVMKAQHRMHARGFFSNMWKDLQLDTMPAARLKRYADMGLSAEDLGRIRAEMAKHTELGKGWLGQQRPVNMHLVKFAPEVREKLALSFWKNQSQTIQRTIGGESAWWMEGTAGKLFSQFRTFPLVAIEKQTLHDLKHMDVETFMTGFASLGFASLAYTAKTYANSFGLPPKKRKQYLKNRLSPEAIAAGAVSWSGQANIMPDLARTVGDFGVSNPFQWSYQKGQAHRDFYREKGLDLGAIGAAGSLLDSAYRFSTGVGQAALTPAEFRKDTFKYAIRPAPFGNNLAVKALQNSLLE